MNLPHDTVSVSKAKERHFALYEKIAQEHARIGAEQAAKRALFESTSEPNIDVRFEDPNEALHVL